MRETKGRESAGPYQMFMLVLCVYAILALALRAFFPLRHETVQILQVVDYGLCAFFLFDFLYQLVRAPDRARYLYTWGWIDLVSSIPVPLARWGRLFRIARIIRVLRTVRAARILLSSILARRAQSTMLAVSLVGILVFMIGSVTVLELERAPGSNIRTPADACWWALSTMTTAGSGDRYPVTNGGRLVGVSLMLIGVGLAGTFAGFLASWFTGESQDRQDDELRELRNEIAALRNTIEGREG